MKAMQRPIIETKTSQAKLCPRKLPLTTAQFITIHHNFNTLSSANASSVLPVPFSKPNPFPKSDTPPNGNPLPEFNTLSQSAQAEIQTKANLSPAEFQPARSD